MTVCTDTEKFHNGTGSAHTFDFPFESIQNVDIKVYVDGIKKTEGTHYNVSGSNIVFTTNNYPAVGIKNIHIYRDTDVCSAKATYAAGSSIRAIDLNNNHDQFLFHAQETDAAITNLTSAQRFFTSTTPPSDPINGAVWYEPTSGRSFVYYTDVDSAAWVESSPAYGSTGGGTQTDITSLTDANIAANANISQSKLNLAITNSEVASNANIAQSKLDLSIANADVASNAAIAQSKLATLSIGNNELAANAVTNAKVDANAAIDASKIVYANSANGGQVRTLESRLDSVININDFIPNGTNTTTANCAGFINNAINALPATGGKIIFPSGLYRLTSPITITKNAVVLEGACGMVVGMDNYGVRFKRDDGDNNTFISITNARSIEIRNIGFNGGTVNNTNTGGAGVKPPNGAIHVIAQAGTQEHIYENLTFDGITFCMHFDGLSSSIIRNCKFRTIPEESSDSHVIKLHGGSSTDRCDQIRIVDCIIDGSPAPALSASSGLGKWTANTSYSAGNKVENDRERIYEVIAPTSGTATSASSGSGPTGAGQSITDGGLTWKWLGNKINQTVRGVYIDGDVSTVFISRTSVIRCRDNYYVTGTWQGNFINFENAEAERAAYDGFNISSQAPTAGSGGNFITIADCFAGTNYEQGINLNTDQDSTVQISNVNCRDNRQNGILINSNTENVSITNPTIGGNGSSNDNTYNGISIASSSNHIYISGGKCGGTTVDLSGTGPQRYGIQVNGNNHDHIVILGVDVSGNTTGAIEYTTTGGNVNASNDNFIQFCPGYSTGQTTFP